MNDNTGRQKHPPTALTHPKYRADIDGIRAIAVLSVVAYHAFPLWGKGGLIGVDIFFVISGFLISTIIFENLQNNRFSFLEFYSRRIRRIFPSLLTVLIFCFCIGWISLLADEFTQLGKHIAGGAGFISNFLFLNESGYFDNAADTKPLLHLWSLGIEEQFYILWPLILWVAWKYRANMAVLTIVIASISFFLNVSTINKDGIAAFYLPQMRFWELLIGSSLAYIMLYRKRIQTRLDSTTNGTNNAPAGAEHSGAVTGSAFLNDILSISGITLIVISCLVIDKKSPFPGWLALLPTLGTAFLIAAGPRAWFNRVILSRRLLIWFGLISYPLYLWHWPLLSFTRIIQSGHPEREYRVAAVMLSIIFAWLTYRFIEKPLRFGNRARLKTTLLFCTMAVVGIFGYYCYLEKGFPKRNVISINPSAKSGYGGGFSKKKLLDDCGIKRNRYIAYCTQDKRQQARFALFGDSKAAALFPGLFRTSTTDGRWLFIGGNGPHGSPAPILSDSKIYKRYQNQAKIGIKAILKQDNIEAVALVTATRVLFNLDSDRSIETLPASPHYNEALAGLSATVQKFTAADKKVVLVIDNPTFADPKDCLERETASSLLNSLLLNEPNVHCKISVQQHLMLSKQYRSLLQEVAAQDPENIKIFDTMKYLCDTKANLCQSHKDGHILYSYSDHLSDYAAGLVGEGLNSFMLEINK